MKSTFGPRRFVIQLAALAACILVTGAAHRAAAQAPQINTLFPAGVGAGGPGFFLEIDGRSLAGAVVNWNGSPRASSNPASSTGSAVFAQISPSDIASPGTVTITVTTPGGTVSNALTFTVGAPFTTIPLSTGTATPGAVATGDFNGDGKPDIAFISFPANSGTPGSVCVLLGKGDATFQAPVCYPVGIPIFIGLQLAQPRPLVVGDFNGDGKPDLAILNVDSVSVLLGNGDGTFQPPLVAPACAVCGPNTLIAGDFNEDGKLDLIVGNTGQLSGLQLVPASISILFGNGDGTFKPHYEFDLNGGILLFADDAASGDFTNDGKLDIVVAPTVVSSNGFATVLNASPPREVDTPSDGTSSVATGRFRSDGNVDVVLLNPSGNGTAVGAEAGAQVVLNPGNGDGTFQTFLPGSTYGTALGAGLQLYSTDINGDGKPDVLLASAGGVSLLLGNGDGTLQPSVEYETPTSGFLAFADFNGDAKSDVVVSQNTSDIFSGVRSNALFLLLQGAFPAATPSPQSLSFGTSPNPPVILNTASPIQSVPVTNSGLASLSVSSIHFAGANPGDFSETDNCSNPVAPTLTCQINVTFTPAGTGTRTATLIITDNAPSQGATQAVSLTGTAVPPPPDFTGTVTPNTQSVSPGLSTSYLITVIPLFGLTGDVTLGIAGLPAGATASFNPKTVSVTGGSAPSTLTITTDAVLTPPGSYTLILSGTSGVRSLTHSTGIRLNVSNPNADFSASINRNTQTIAAGAGTGYSITLIPLGGFTGSVALTVSGTPPGATAFFSPASISASSPSTALTVTTSSSTPPGQYQLLLTGTSGALVHSTGVLLIVGTPPPDFTGTVTPLTGPVLPGAPASYAIKLVPLNGFTGFVTLSLSGLPQGTSASFSPGTVSPTAPASTLTVTTSNSTPPGSYVLILTGTSASLAHSTGIDLVVASP